MRTCCCVTVSVPTQAVPIRLLVVSTLKTFSFFMLASPQVEVAWADVGADVQCLIVTASGWCGLWHTTKAQLLSKAF